MPYVRLLTIQNIREGGVVTTYHPGDVINVGKQTARNWVLEGSAEDPFRQLLPVIQADGSFGIVVMGKKGTKLGPLEDLRSKIEVTYSGPAIPYKNTLVWHPSAKVSVRLVEYGFLRIMDELSWDMAACLVDLTTLADSIGSDKDREGTKELLGSLRLPVYEPGLVWLRKSPKAHEFVDLWVGELEKKVHPKHAFLRALYTSKAMICTMPPDCEL